MSSRVNTYDNSDLLRFEVRKVQQLKDGRSLMVTLPTRYVKRMDLHKGDLLKMYSDHGGKLLVAEKVDLGQQTKSGYYNQGGVP